MTTSSKKIKVAIAGTGKIIPESATALQEMGYEITAIWGPHHEKAVPLAQIFDIPKVCYSYDELLDCGVDFVYIALVNTAHFDYAAKALEAGINVLLEKPFCSNILQAEHLATLCKEKGLFLFETISNLYLPAWKTVKERLPELGKIKLFQADFSQYSSRYDDYLSGKIGSAFDPEMEGGALRDLNIYNLHLAIDLFGKPDEIIFRANRGYNGIDTSGTVILNYQDLLAICTAAKDSANPSCVTIQGEKGWIRIAGMPNILPKVEVYIRSKCHETFSPNKYTSRLCHQFEAIREVYLNNDRAEMLRRLSHTLLVMQTLCKCTVQ